MEILCDDHFVVAASTASQWATRKKIALKDLMNEQWILFPKSNVTSPYIDAIFRANGLARISHSKKCIGAPNQRKFFCDKDFPQIRGRPDANRTVARTYSVLQR